MLERSAPFTSVLSGAMHARFIAYLQAMAPVKAFGFKDLIASQDVCDLLGLVGQDEIAFHTLPVENDGWSGRLDKSSVKELIKSELDKLNLLRKIRSNQLYE